jgi:hypothetical protein
MGQLKGVGNKQNCLLSHLKKCSNASIYPFYPKMPLSILLDKNMYQTKPKHHCVWTRNVNYLSPSPTPKMKTIDNFVYFQPPSPTSDKIMVGALPNQMIIKVKLLQPWYIIQKHEISSLSINDIQFNKKIQLIVGGPVIIHLDV